MLRAPSKSTGATRSLKFIAVLIILGGGAWWATQAQTTTDAKKPRVPFAPAVAVAPVQKKDVAQQLEALGTVTSTYTVTVRSRVDGLLEKVDFTEGKEVKEGQLLAELDPRAYQATLTQAQGQLQRDQALLQNAQIDLTRYRQLLAQNSIAQQQVDTQEALVKQYEGTVKIDQGNVESAKLQLSYTRISAPISGRLGLRQADPGNLVHASDTNGVVVITQVQPINVVFSVPEPSLAKVLQAKAGGNTLKVEAWDRDNTTLLAKGNLLAIDNQLSTTSGTVSLKARFDNQDQKLFPNQFVNVHLLLGDQPDAITVPTVALQIGKPGSYVYTLNEDKTVSMTKVNTGGVSGRDTVITSGVHPGQRVVVDGLDKLRDGASVQIAERSAAEPGQGGAGSGEGRKKQGQSGSNRPAGADASGPRGDKTASN